MPNLTRQEIAELLHEQGIEVSVTVVDQLLERHHYRRRKAQKRLTKEKGKGLNPRLNLRFSRIYSVGVKSPYVFIQFRSFQFRSFQFRSFLHCLSTGAHPKRNEQFENIEQLVETYQAAGNPVMSMDTKKKN